MTILSLSTRKFETLSLKVTGLNTYYRFDNKEIKYIKKQPEWSENVHKWREWRAILMIGTAYPSLCTIKVNLAFMQIVIYAWFSMGNDNQ